MKTEIKKIILEYEKLVNTPKNYPEKNRMIKCSFWFTVKTQHFEKQNLTHSKWVRKNVNKPQLLL